MLRTLSLRWVGLALVCPAVCGCGDTSSRSASKPQPIPTAFRSHVNPSGGLTVAVPEGWAVKDDQSHASDVWSFSMSAPDDFPSAAPAVPFRSDPSAFGSWGVAITVQSRPAQPDDRSLADVVAHHEPPRRGRPVPAGQSAGIWIICQASCDPTRLDGEPASLVVQEPVNPPSADAPPLAGVPTFDAEVIALHHGRVYTLHIDGAAADADFCRRTLAAVVARTRFTDDTPTTRPTMRP